MPKKKVVPKSLVEEVLGDDGPLCPLLTPREVDERLERKYVNEQGRGIPRHWVPVRFQGEDFYVQGFKASDYEDLA